MGIDAGHIGRVTVAGLDLRVLDTGVPPDADEAAPVLLVIPGHTARIEGFEDMVPPGDAQALHSQRRKIQKTECPFTGRGLGKHRSILTRRAFARRKDHSTCRTTRRDIRRDGAWALRPASSRPAPLGHAEPGRLCTPSHERGFPVRLSPSIGPAFSCIILYHLLAFCAPWCISGV